MNLTFRVLSIILGAFSVVSFIQNLFNVGVYEMALTFINFYRQVTHFIFAAPFEVFDLIIPNFLIDLWALSFVGATAYVQTKGIDKSRFYRRHPEMLLSSYWKIKLWFLWGFSGLGLWVLLSSISPITYMDHMHEEPLDIAKNAAKNVFFIFIATVVFFIFNAFGPTLA